MIKSKVTLELSITEGSRVSGWGESAVQEYILRHPKLAGDIRLRCQRRDIDEVLEDLSVSAVSETFGANTEVTLVDVGNELARSSTGVPLSKKEQEELENMLEQKDPQTQQDNPFKIKIG